MTRHQVLAEWVNHFAALCQPDQIHWCDGSPEEYQLMLRLMVQAGTAMRMILYGLNSIFVRSDPADVARVEDRTYICSVRKEDAGPTSNWADPAEMKATLTGLFTGSMKGKDALRHPGTAWARWGRRSPGIGVELIVCPTPPCPRPIAARSAANAVDLILLDVTLPGITGFEVCKRIRAQGGLRQPNIIMLTGLREVVDKVTGLKMGADDYLTKPFDLPELLARVRAQLRIRELQEKLVQAEKLAIIGQMAITLSHKINNPAHHDHLAGAAAPGRPEETPQSARPHPARLRGHRPRRAPHRARHQAGAPRHQPGAHPLRRPDHDDRPGSVRGRVR